MAIQSYHRGLRKMIVAPWVAANSYGVSYPILGARNGSITINVETDEARGDDVVLDQYSKPISANVSLEMASVDLKLLSIVLGGTLTEAIPYDDMSFGEADEIPYVAIAVRVAGSGGTGDLHIFIPKAKLSSGLTFQAQTDTYMFPTMDFVGVHEGTVNGIFRQRNFTSSTNLAIPLRTTVGAL